ncbi:mpv17 2 [Argonauta hians]
MALSNARNAVKKIFAKYLLLTNTATCGGLLALGDAVTQKFEHWGQDPTTFKHDWARTGRMFTVGLFMGPPTHFWYSFLDKMLVGKTGKTVVKKILADQAVAAPYFCTTFLIGMSLMEGKTWKASVAEWKGKFLTIYKMDWMIWPPSQFVNFYFLPTQYRVLYVSCITLGWNTLLSYIKHKKQQNYELTEENEDSTKSS